MNNLSKPKAATAGKSAIETANRRSEERFPFSAVTVLTDSASGTRISARVSDISLTGCYLDVINVFAAGTKIEISIDHTKQHFVANGAVAYSLPQMGMGITFDPVAPEMISILKRWIAQVNGDTVPADETPEAARASRNYSRVERHILGRLIALLMRKTIVTDEEGEALLEELLRENLE